MTDPLENPAAAGRAALLEDMHLPAFDKLRDTSRRRRLRTRLLTVAAIVVVAALALVVGGVRAVAPQPLAPDGSSTIRGPIVAKQIPRPPHPGGCTFQPVTEKVIFYFFYVDKTCDVDESGVGYAVTTDGGQHWNMYLPPSDSGDCAGIEVLGPHDVLMCGYISHDDGETWARTPGRAADVEAVPAGWRLLDIDQNLTAVNPRTGQQARLANDPVIGTMPTQAAPVLAPDGSIWVTNHLHGDDGTARISRDRGRTWRPVRLPAPYGSAPGIASMTSSDGKTGCLTTHDGNKMAVLRTTDGGANWSLVTPDTSDTGGGVLPGPNGSILGISLTHSTDGCATFKRLPGLSAEGTLNLNGIHTYYVEGANPTEIWVASASLRFTKIGVPPGF